MTTLSPAFVPTLQSFSVFTEAPTVRTTTTAAPTTTTRALRFKLFRRKGPKRFRPRLQIQEEEINEIEESSDSDVKESFRGVKLPRRLNRFRPKNSAIRGRRPTAAPATTAAEPLVTTFLPVAVTTTEAPAPVAVTTTRSDFTFFGADSRATPGPAREPEIRVVEVDNTNLAFRPAASPEAPIVFSRPGLPSVTAFQPALLNEAPRSQGSAKQPKALAAPAPVKPVVPSQPVRIPSIPSQNSLFENFSPSVFNQNVLRQSQQAQAVQPASTRPVAIRPQPVQRRPQPQPVQRRPPPVPVRPQPQPQVVRQPQQPAAPAQRRPQAAPRPAPVRTNLFPTFELPDFFTIPFVAFRSLEQPRSQAAAGSANRQPATGGALFNSIGH